MFENSGEKEIIARIVVAAKPLRSNEAKSGTTESRSQEENCAP